MREKIIFRLIAPSILSPTSLGNYQCEEICQYVKICNDEKKPLILSLNHERKCVSCILMDEAIIVLLYNIRGQLLLNEN